MYVDPALVGLCCSSSSSESELIKLVLISEYQAYFMQWPPMPTQSHTVANISFLSSVCGFVPLFLLLLLVPLLSHPVWLPFANTCTCICSIPFYSSPAACTVVCVFLCVYAHEHISLKHGMVAHAVVAVPAGSVVKVMFRPIKCALRFLAYATVAVSFHPPYRTCYACLSQRGLRRRSSAAHRCKSLANVCFLCWPFPLSCHDHGCDA